MDRDDQLAELLERWEDAIAAGHPLTPDDLCGKTPELRHEFTQILRNLGKVDPVLQGQVSVTESGNDEIDAGRYVPKSFHAKGGLGLVYLAEDTELRRSVALKWMQHLPAMDSRSRMRFMNEAEITGKLEHPGVAPVYGAGKDPRGRPFYAMRFIQGKTLSDEIKDFHSQHKHEYQSGEFARLLRKFVAACQTVAYAHARGVIHRDIKPGNVMIGPYGETLLVDWGLAKTYNLADPEGTVDTGFAPVQLDINAPENSLDGEVKGSPAYMSPEQAMGETSLVGPRSDIYALGATLYVLLTGKSLYPSRNSAEIIHELKQRSPAINPDNEPVPKALLAICRKAMARIPGDRYENALFVADDVDRWLADEPVKVHRDGLVTRTRRWVKNHRTLVSTTVAMLLIGIVAMIVVIPILSGKNRDLAKANIDLADSNTQLTQANDANRQMVGSRNTDFVDTEASLRKIMDQLFAYSPAKIDPELETIRTKAIRDYRDHLQTYVDRNREDMTVRVPVATALMKIGECEEFLADIRSAVKAYEESTAIFETIVSENPGNRDARLSWASTMGKLAEARLLYRSDSREVFRLLKKSRAELETLCNEIGPVHLSGATQGSVESWPAVRLAQVAMMFVRYSHAHANSEKRLLEYQADLMNVSPEVAESVLGLKESQNFRRELERVLKDNLDVLKRTMTLLTSDRALPDSAPELVQAMALHLQLMLATKTQDPQAHGKLKSEKVRIAKLLKDHPDWLELRYANIELNFTLCLLENSQKLLSESLELSEELLKLDYRKNQFSRRGELLETRMHLATMLSQHFAGSRNVEKVRECMTITLQALEEYHQLKFKRAHTEESLIDFCYRWAVGQGNSTSLQKEAEQFYTHVVKMIENLPSTPDRLSYPSDRSTTKLQSQIGVVKTRLNQKKPVAHLFPAIDSALDAVIQQRPKDLVCLFYAADIFLQKSLDAELHSTDYPRAISMMDLGNKRILEARDGGYEVVACLNMQMIYDVRIVELLRRHANAELKLKPEGSPEIVAMIDRALTIVNGHVKSGLPKEFDANAFFKPMYEQRLKYCEQSIPQLQAIRKQANGGK